MTSRRTFLGGSLASLLAACADDRSGKPPLVPGEGAFAKGLYLGDVPFLEEVVDQLLGALDGEGLDGRRRVDLAALTPSSLLLAPEQFYVRTREPKDLPAPWPIAVGGLVDAPFEVTPGALVAAAVDQGEHLMECSGNGKGERYGLMSSTRWRGVPLVDLLARANPRREGTRVLVQGKDHAEQSPNGSIPGSSWIFSWEQLAAANAILATHMHDRPLTPEHGAPVRLYVPGWYGCCSTKWVERIEVVPDDAPSTPHMREFAGRTHQEGTPELARDFKPAALEFTALPVRVEEWRVDGAPRYRVWGLAWGGTRPAERLNIKFVADDPWRRITGYTPAANANGWTLWWHDWKPTGWFPGGEYTIYLKSPDKGLAQGRLRRGWYKRSVRIA